MDREHEDQFPNPQPPSHPPRPPVGVRRPLTLATPRAQGATDTANAAAIRSNLPTEVTLKQASIKQTAAALHEAVRQHHDDALDLLRIAILAKTPKQGHGELSCEDLRRLVQAACTAAVDKTSQLVDLANSLHPDCADSLQNLLAAAGGDAFGSSGDAFGSGGDAYGLGGDGYGFGVGFGPGFPGAPGFVGSGPSGGFALPPASPAPLTPTRND